MPNDQVIEQRSERTSLITRDFVLVTTTALVFFVYVGMLVAIVPLYVEERLDAGEFGIGLTVAAFAIAAIAARPIIGRIADRYGRRSVIVGGAMLAAAAGGLSGVVASLPVLLFLRGITGVGEAAMFVGAATLIADMSPPDRRAEAASYFSVAVFGGLGVGPILGELALADDHYTRAFAIAGVFALFGALLGLRVPSRVDTPEGDPEFAARMNEYVATHDAIPSDGKRPFVHPAALLPGLVLASAVVGFAAFSAFLPEFARDNGMSGAGILFGVYSLTSLLVRIFGARLPETLGPRRSVTLALGFVTAGLLVIALAPSTPTLFLASALLGVGVALNYPSLMALTINRASDDDRAAAVSSFTMFFEIGSAVGGIVLGAFAQVVGKQAGFLGGVAFALLGIWILRTRVVPADAPDAGPTPVHRHAVANLAPVTCD